MGLWKKIFTSKRNKILATMAAFTDAAFLMLPEADYAHDESLKKTVFVFLFGALDALIQPFNYKDEEKIFILRKYFQQTFQTMTQSELDRIVAFLIDASGNPTWIPIMQRGGQTLIDWGNGEAKAPLTLSHLVHFGIEDTDMMIRDRKK